MKKIKSLIVFDLNGTLANGDAVIVTEMVNLLTKLLENTNWLLYPVATGLTSKRIY